MTEQDYYIHLIKKLSSNPQYTPEEVRDILLKNPNLQGKICSKSSIYQTYNLLKQQTKFKLTEAAEAIFIKNIKKKPIRTLSGVTTVTVLTKPYPCPGKCIFCPNDTSMPKSYLSNEPGAQRAYANHFDPYLQTYNRILALHNNGHKTSKIELIVLGGTFTFYPKEYQKWFIKRCFDAMNSFSVDSTPNVMSFEKQQSPTLLKNKKYILSTYNNAVAHDQLQEDYSLTDDELKLAQQINETAETRCVGMSLETRPDEVTWEVLMYLRQLGATKIQMGVQTLDDEVLKLNKREHDVNAIKKAFALIRLAGFKIQVHWMPNLYGSSPDKDIYLYKELMNSPEFIPDEVKIYPCSLIDNTELMEVHKKGLWKPYSYDELNDVITQNIIDTPRFVRISRVIRDIPSTDIVVGNKLTNLRQIINELIHQKGAIIKEIRSREIQTTHVSVNDLHMHITPYETIVSSEYFIEYVDKNDDIAGFLRLSLPKIPQALSELSDAAIIREIHVYGQSLDIGSKSTGHAQHIGLGKSLILKAENIAKINNYRNLAVISSVGTRDYYRKNGFKDGILYQRKLLTPNLTNEQINLKMNL
jgi:elongator complex protein 3